MKVSIIVPVYKVEKYLHRCVDSILAQTYTDFECILVDDGSPDNCGKICDEYAAKDSRIKVIHQENGGRSKARNAGLDFCDDKGYITFIDSDDFVTTDYLEILVKEMNESNADIVYFNWYTIYDDNKRVLMKTTGDCQHTTEEIQHKILMDYWLNSLVDKIYKAELFKDIRFPIGRDYEDAYLVPQVVCRAKKIKCIKDALYFYERSNFGSIMNNFDSKGAYDIFGYWMLRLEKFDLNKNQRIYCTEKAKHFAFEAYALHSVDRKLVSKSILEIENFLHREKNVFYILKSRILCKVIGNCIKMKHWIRIILRRNSTLYSWWMKYKTGQKI